VSRTIERLPDGRFVVSDDDQGVLANFLYNAVVGMWADEDAFGPDGDGVWVDTLGGATRMDADSPVRPDDPELDPSRDELWVVVRERRREIPHRVVLTGDELRDLLSRARSLVPSDQ